MKYLDWRWSPLALAVTLLPLAGCFGGGDQWTKNLPQTVKASGVVTHNGTPVENASVVFAPIAPGEHAASGRTDSRGRFELKAFPSKDGAVPGKYRVAVSKTVEKMMKYEIAAVDAGEDAEHAEEDDESPQFEEGVGWENVLPKQYANPNNSGIELEIPEDGTASLEIELTG